MISLMGAPPRLVGETILTGLVDVQQFVAGKFQQKAGWQTVRNAWTLLSGILETAVEYGYLTANPARGVKFPPQALREAPALIAGDDFAKLLGEVVEPYRMMIGLIAATGLRVGELLALRWRSLDLHIGTLTVRESVFEGKMQQPKTLKARRTIPLGPHAIKLLKRIAIGQRAGPTRICCSPTTRVRRCGSRRC